MENLENLAQEDISRRISNLNELRKGKKHQIKKFLKKIMDLTKQRKDHKKKIEEYRKLCEIKFGHDFSKNSNVCSICGQTK